MIQIQLTGGIGNKMQEKVMENMFQPTKHVHQQGASCQPPCGNIPIQRMHAYASGKRREEKLP